MCRESGLKGLSGISNDVRDLVAQAAEGNGRARLALDVFVHQIRHWIGAYHLELNGLDALVFTAGIGENQWRCARRSARAWTSWGSGSIRRSTIRQRATEGAIGSKGAPVRILVIPTNEELVVAREVKRHLETN
jgi:acetate kinase